MKTVQVYTDGACSGNPGPGGWGAVLMFNGAEREFSGFCEDTTNNRMELMAVIMALKKLKEKCDVEIFSDSAYVCDAFNKKWIDSWQRSQWKNSQNKDVKNQDLWKSLLFELSKHARFSFIKVKGHSDNEYNNKCDKLATDEIKKNASEKK